VTRLTELLGLSSAEAEEMTNRLTRARERRTAYCRIRRGVERRLAERILKLAKKDPALESLTLEDSPARVNPSGTDAIQLLGPVNVDGQGVEGLEMFLDPVLRGHDGERRVRVSATGEAIPSTEVRLKEPRDGGDVRLALDRDIQHFVEGELRKVCEEQTPDAATAIVMDVHTGDVLAMANYPSYVHGQKQIPAEARKNRAVTDLFEPGSIFKVLTAGAALENGVSCNFYCGGTRTIGNRTIHCAHGERHGAVDMRKMIEQSCNIAAGGLAEKVGAEKMYAFLTSMGLQSKTGIEFPGEENARFLPAEKWRIMRTVNIGFGQGVVVTPIQLLAAYAAIGNDGMYNPPRLVVDAPDHSKLPHREPHRVLTPENARKLRSYMESVVESGTGKAAKIPGYSVCGKTGTAQIAKHGSYKGNGYVASFAGCVPAKKPELAILVSVWHPRKGEYGGTVSAPVFREIARQCVQFLRIPPDAPQDMRDGARPGTMVAKAGGKPAKHND
jgi:cell division protein FtsI/penicillin-binding protein 2